MFSPIILKSKILKDWENEAENKIIWFTAHYYSEYHRRRIRQLFSNSKLNEYFYGIDTKNYTILENLLKFFYPELQPFQLLFLRSKSRNIFEIHFDINSKVINHNLANKLIIPKEIVDYFYEPLYKEIEHIYVSLLELGKLYQNDRQIKELKINYDEENVEELVDNYQSFYKWLISNKECSYYTSKIIILLKKFEQLRKDFLTEDKNDFLIHSIKYFKDYLQIVNFSKEDVLKFVQVFLLFGQGKRSQREFLGKYIYYIPAQTLNLTCGGISFATQKPLVNIEKHEFLSLANNIFNCSSLAESRIKTAISYAEVKKNRALTILSNLNSHASTKLYTTPIKNSVYELQKMISKDEGKMAIESINMVTELWEGNLSVLERYSNILRNKGRLWCKSVYWDLIASKLERFAEVFFYNRINDLYDDSYYKIFFDLILKEKQFGFRDFFNLEINFNGVNCLGHQNLFEIHLLSFLNNAIEASTFTRVADFYLKEKITKIPKNIKDTISFKAIDKFEWIILEIKNTCIVREEDRIKLNKIDKYLEKIFTGEIHVGDKNIAESMLNREFTSKSGASHGWALLLAGDYFSRLQIIYDGNILRKGQLSISTYNEKIKPFNLLFELKIPKAISNNEELILCLE